MAYFDFDFNDSSKQGAESLLRSILSQIVVQSSEMPDQLLSAYNQSHSGQQQPKVDTMKMLLRQLLHSSRSTFILIDALDECTNLRDLMELITEIAVCQTSKTSGVFTHPRVQPSNLPADLNEVVTMILLLAFWPFTINIL